MLKLPKTLANEAEFKEIKPIYQGLYAKQADGSYELDGDMHDALDTTGLNTALANERRDRKKADDELKVFKKLNLTAEEFSELAALGKPGELKTKLEQAAKGSTEAVKDLERRIADIQRGHNEALAEKEKQLTGMRGSLEKYLIGERVTAALQAAKGSIKLLAPHIQNRARVVEDGKGGYEVRVLDAAGEFEGDGKGGFLTVAGLVEQYKKDKDFATAFEPTREGGGGTKPGPKHPGGGGLEGQDSSSLISQGLQQMGR